MTFDLISYLLSVAIDSVEITSAPDRTLYTEESVTLTCEITLSPSVNTAVDVSVTWSGTQGEMLSTDGRVTVSDVTWSAPYKSTLNLSSLVISDTGRYTCTASVGPSTPQVVASGDVTDAHTITVGEEGYFHIDVHVFVPCLLDISVLSSCACVYRGVHNQ